MKNSPSLKELKNINIKSIIEKKHKKKNTEDKQIKNSENMYAI